MIIYTHIVLEDKIFQGGPNISETYGPGSKNYGGPSIPLQSILNLLVYTIATHLQFTQLFCCTEKQLKIIELCR